jgi:hypothetical protein
MWAVNVIFTKLPKENNCPLGENSPILVTLEHTFPFLEQIIVSPDPDLDGRKRGPVEGVDAVLVLEAVALEALELVAGCVKVWRQKLRKIVE